MIPTPNPLQPPSTTRDGVTRLSEAEGRRLVQESARRAKPPEPLSPLPCVAVEILDEDVMRAMNPLRRDGHTFALAHAFDGPVVAHLDGRDVCRSTPMPPGTVPSSFVSLAEYEMLAGDPALGHDDDAAESDEFEAEGIEALREIMAHAPPKGGMTDAQGLMVAHELQAIAVARRYHTPKVAIERELGHPIELGRALLKPGGMATKLRLAKARAQAKVERAQAEERARIADATTPRSLAELGLEALWLDTQALGFGWPPVLHDRPTWFFAGGHAVPYRALPGLGLPADLTFGYFRVLPPSTVIPAMPPTDAGLPHIANTPIANAELVEFVRAIRRNYLPNIHRGPIEPGRFTRDGEPIAKALIEAHAPLMVRRQLGLHWVLPVVVEAVVRGCLLRPDQAAALIHAELVAEHERSTPAHKSFVGPGTLARYEGPSLETLAELCGKAAHAGEVEAGSLLPQTKSKKGK